MMIAVLFVVIAVLLYISYLQRQSLRSLRKAMANQTSGIASLPSDAQASNNQDQATQTEDFMPQLPSVQTWQEQIDTIFLLYPDNIRLVAGTKNTRYFFLSVFCESAKRASYKDKASSQSFFKVFPTMDLRICLSTRQICLMKHEDIPDISLVQRIISEHENDLPRMILALEELLTEIFQQDCSNIQRIIQQRSYQPQPPAFPNSQLHSFSASEFTSSENVFSPPGPRSHPKPGPPIEERSKEVEDTHQYQIQDFKDVILRKEQDEQPHAQTIELGSAAIPMSKSVSVYYETQSRFKTDFEILEKIGSGTFGHVYKARNRLDNSLYAIKKILLDYSSEQLCQKTKQEAVLLAKLYHTNIVRYYQAWTEHASEAQIKEMKNHDQTEDEEEGQYSESEDKEEPQPQQAVKEEVIEELDEGYDDGQDYEYEYVYYYENGNEAEWNEQNLDINFHGPSNQQQTNSQKGVSQSMKGNKKAPGPKKKQFLFIQMEYCSGETLKQIIDEGKLSSDQKREIIRQILSALAYMHSKNYIHRDLKPQNIFLSHNLQIKLGDFGLATEMKAEIQQQDRHGAKLQLPETLLENIKNDKNIDMTKGCGTLMYLAPEQQYQTQYDAKADMYSLGILIFEFYSRFNSDMQRFECIQQLKKAEGALPLEFFQRVGLIDEDVRKIIISLVSKDPKKRYSSGELLSQFEDKQTVQIIASLANPNHREFQLLIEQFFGCHQLVPAEPRLSIYHRILGKSRENFLRDFVFNMNEWNDRVEIIFRLRGAVRLPYHTLIPFSSQRNYQRIDDQILRYTAKESKAYKVMTQDGELVQYSQNLLQSAIYELGLHSFPKFKRYQFGEVTCPNSKHITNLAIYDIMVERQSGLHLAELLSIGLESIHQFDWLGGHIEIHLSHTLLFELILIQLGFNSDFILQISQSPIMEKIQKYADLKKNQKNQTNQSLYDEILDEGTLKQATVDKLISFCSSQHNFQNFDKTLFQPEQRGGKQFQEQSAKTTRLILQKGDSKKSEDQDFEDFIRELINRSELRNVSKQQEQNKSIDRLIQEVKEFTRLIDNIQYLHQVDVIFKTYQKNEMSGYFTGLSFEIVEINSHQREYEGTQRGERIHMIGGEYSHYMPRDKLGQAERFGYALHINMNHGILSKYLHHLNSKAQQKFQPFRKRAFNHRLRSGELKILIFADPQTIVEAFQIAQQMWEHRVSASIVDDKNKVKKQSYSKEGREVDEVYLERQHDGRVRAKMISQIKGELKDLDIREVIEELKRLRSEQKEVEVKLADSQSDSKLGRKWTEGQQESKQKKSQK